MVNKKYIQRFEILVLILGMLSVAMAITIDSPPGDNIPVNNITTDPPMNFVIVTSDNVNVTWYVNGSSHKTNTNVTSSFYSNASLASAAGNLNVTVNVYNSSDASYVGKKTWFWTITTPPLPVETAPIFNVNPTHDPLDTSANISFTINQSNANTTVRYGLNLSTLTLGSTWENGSSFGSLRIIQLSGLSPGTQYYYSVYAYNWSNNTFYINSTINNFTTKNPSSPNVSNITIGPPTSTTISISFDVNQTDALTSIHYGIDSGSLGNSTSYNTLRTVLLSSLSPGTLYYFSIFAKNVTNQSYISNSTIQNFTTKYPAPTISTIEPSNTSAVEMIVGESKNLTVTIGSQGGNLSWYLNSDLLTSKSVNSTESVIYTFTKNIKGTYNITANLSNINGSDIRKWTINVHPTTFSTGNRIWDGSKPDDFSRTYSWNPMSFSGFYYGAKDDVGNENITIELLQYNSRSILKDKLTYSTSPQEVSFAHSNFKKYQVIGFMADKYFAGYNANTSIAKTRPTTDFSGKSAVAQGQLHKVLIDEDVKRTISVGGTFALKEGYVLKAKDIDLNARTMLLSLLKDGNEVDIQALTADETYVYSKNVGSVDGLPLIMMRFDNVFSGQELQVAFIKGLFQISEDATVVKTGNRFGSMEVTEVNKDIIKMKNSGDIGLGKGTTATIMGDVKIIVANNESVTRFALSVEKKGDFEIRSTVYKDSTPLEWTPYNFGMNIGKTSLGFFYDLDDGVGSEKLTLLKAVSGRSIPDRDLVYSTSPQEVKFTYTGFGKYQVIGFMADKYFAGYTSNTGISSAGKIITRPSTDFDGISALAGGNLHKVLIDDDTKRTISVGSTISLQDGYVIKATDIDLRARTMLLSLLKDGAEVDISPLSSGETYVYAKTVGGTEDLPLIMVRFENVFSGQELQVAFLKGIFQIQENPTTVKVADQFGKMEVTSVSSSLITMSNDGSIGLDKNKNDVLMGNLKLKVADNDALRFYFAVDVTADMIQNQLVIDAPSKVMAGDTLQVKVTAGGKGVDNATMTLDTEMGTTGNNGTLNYIIPKTLKAGTYTITATKTGYEKATKNIEIEKYVDYRLSIEAPSNANQYEMITIKVLYNGSAMSGASVVFDNSTVGTTNSTGEVTYRLETSGTHSITASKVSYITVSRDIDIRAPFSEFKALDINITPNPVFTGDDFRIMSNITNVGTKSDTLPVDLIINGSVVENRTVTLGAGEKVQINFTRQEATAANITVDIMGQSKLLEVQKKPTNYLLIAAIATGIGALVIYILTSKGLLSVEILNQKFEAMKQIFNNRFKK